MRTKIFCLDTYLGVQKCTEQDYLKFNLNQETNNETTFDYQDFKNELNELIIKKLYNLKNSDRNFQNFSLKMKTLYLSPI